MSVAARFRNAPSGAAPMSRKSNPPRRPLYQNESDAPSLLTVYRGNMDGAAGEATMASITGEVDVLLMTDAERANMAEELDELEQLQQQQQQNAYSPAHIHVMPTTLQSHFDPQLLSDASFKAWQMRHHPKQRGAEDGSARDEDDAFFDKNARWKDHVALKNDILRKELQAQAAAECTFRPNINRKQGSVRAGRHAWGPSPRAEGGETVQENIDEGEGGEEAGGRESHDDTVNRLLRYEHMKHRRLELKAAEIRQEEDLECTFRPKTLKRAWTGNVTPRYLDEPGTTPGRHRRVADNNGAVPLRNAVDADSGDGATHRPVINRRIVGMEISGRLEHYMHTPVHERLHREAVQTMERKRRQEALRTGEAATDAAARFGGKTAASGWTRADTTLSSIGAATQWTDRGDDDDSAGMPDPSRRTPAAKLDEGNTVVPKATASSRAEPPPPLSDEFLSRLRESIKRKEENLGALRRKADSGCSFHPIIKEYRHQRTSGVPSKHRCSTSPEQDEAHLSRTPRIDRHSSELVERRSVQDLLKYDKDKQQKLARLKQEADEREAMDGCTFSPQISRYAKSVPGKIAASTASMSEYKKFVAMQRRIRQRDVEFHIRERRESELAEDRELTFKPEVHEAPSYIHEIVRELRENRRVSSTRAASSSVASGDRRSRLSAW